MKALSLWQPWAELVARGVKRVETRSWHTRYRGPLAIHAAARWTAQLSALCFQPPFRAALQLHPLQTPHSQLSFSAVIATVQLVGCIRTEDAAAYLGARYEDELPFGDFGPGRYAWLLMSPLRVYHTCTGRRGLFEVPL